MSKNFRIRENKLKSSKLVISIRRGVDESAANS